MTNMKTRSFRVVPYLLAGALVIFVATLALAQGGKPAQSPIIQSIGMVPITEEIPSPDFTLKDPSGKEVALSSYAGRYVLLNFWATWCVPCREEMPSLQTLAGELEPLGLSVIAVSSLESPSLVSSFLEENDLSLQTALDEDGLLAYRYGVRGLPLTYLISPDGKIVAAKIGAQDWAAEAVVSGLKNLVAGI